MSGIAYALAGAVGGLGQAFLAEGERMRKEAEQRLQRQQNLADESRRREWKLRDRDNEREYNASLVNRQSQADNAALTQMFGQDDRFEAQSGTLGDLLIGTESGGDFDALFGFSNRPGGRFEGVRVSEKTLDELFEFSDVNGEYGQSVKGQIGRVATPMGVGQIVGTTLRATAQAMNLPGDTKFTPEVQMQMVGFLADQALSGKTTPGAKRQAMRAVWEGFNKVSDAQLDQAIAQFEKGNLGVRFTEGNQDLINAATAPGVSAGVQGLAVGQLNPTPAKPADEYERYVREETAAGGTPLSRIDFAQAKRGSEIIRDGEGNVIVQRGPGNMKPMTVDQGKNTGFFIRMRDANSILDEVAGEGSSFRGRILENMPFNVGNYMQTPDYQRFEQARRDFVNAVLRRESGAVISDSEFANADRQYFPVPGDSAEVIEQKRLNRLNAIAGIEISSGPGAGLANARENTQSAPSEPSLTAERASQLSLEQIGQIDLMSISDERVLDALERRFKELNGE